MDTEPHCHPIPPARDSSANHLISSHLHLTSNTIPYPISIFLPCCPFHSITINENEYDSHSRHVMVKQKQNPPVTEYHSTCDVKPPPIAKSQNTSCSRGGSSLYTLPYKHESLRDTTVICKVLCSAIHDALLQEDQPDRNPEWQQPHDSVAAAQIRGAKKA